MDLHGVVIKPLRKIPDQRGCIFPMLRNDDPGFTQFGEIYFSLIYPGVVKGWHLHTRMTLNYVVIKGMIKLALYDGREDSPTGGQLKEIFLGDQNYCLVTIPPGIWNGFKGLGGEASIVANCATIPHDPKEIQRLEPHNSFIPYDWRDKDG